MGDFTSFVQINKKFHSFKSVFLLFFLNESTQMADFKEGKLPQLYLYPGFQPRMSRRPGFTDLLFFRRNPTPFLKTSLKWRQKCISSQTESTKIIFGKSGFDVFLARWQMLVKCEARWLNLIPGAFTEKMKTRCRVDCYKMSPVLWKVHPVSCEGISVEDRCKFETSANE